MRSVRDFALGRLVTVDYTLFDVTIENPDRAPRAPFCTSPRCAPRSDTYVPVDKKKIRDSVYCPDCGYAVVWRKA